MNPGEEAFKLARWHAENASAALEGGHLEEARAQTQLADVYSRLALAAAVVLNSTSPQAGTYRIYVGGLGL
jgi:hypothetical protein